VSAGAARHDLGAPAVIDGGRRLRRGQLEARVARLAGGLRDRAAVRRGHRVAFDLSARAEYFELHAAVSALGASLVAVGRGLDEDAARRVVAHSGARVVVLDAPERLGAALNRGPTASALDAVVWVGEEVPPGALAYESLLEGSSPVLDIASGPAPPALVYTSGTTGRPKAAIRELGPDARRARADMYADLFGTLGFRPGDRHLLCCGVDHAQPAFYARQTLERGGSVFVVRRFEPEAALDLIESERITTAFLVPDMLRRVLALPEASRRGRELSSLRALISGGAALPPALRQEVAALFGDRCLFDLYGSVELGLVTVLEPGDAPSRPGSVGRPLAGVRIRILDEAGRRLDTGELGHVFVRSPVQVAGYLDDEPAFAAATRDGFFAPGDLGRVDADGYLYLVDRAAEVVLVDGRTVFPGRVEEVLRTHPAVLDAAVHGVGDGEDARLGAAIELGAGASLDVEELTALAARRLESHERPELLRVVSALPRNSLGKVIKHALGGPKSNGEAGGA